MSPVSKQNRAKPLVIRKRPNENEKGKYKTYDGILGWMRSYVPF